MSLDTTITTTKNATKNGCKTKKDRKNCSWVEHTVEIHPGSYAHQEQRALLSVLVSTYYNDIPLEHNTSTTTKRKICMLVGFLGDNYSGFQINPGVRTVQAEIELALYKIGAIDPRNFGYPHKYSWSSSSRTDKGVHAAAQAVSLKAEFRTDIQQTEDDLRNLLNDALPEDVRILDINRTTSRFHAKTSRSYVRYRYMLPSFMLLQEPDKLDGEALNSGRISSDVIAKFRETLAKYQGARSYHNFTKRVQPNDPSAKRCIISFQAEDPFVDSATGMEWIPTLVVGQSFLLHQIRKMASHAIAVTRGSIDFDTAFSADAVVMPPAPAQGLFLDMTFYDTYNQRKERTKSHVPHLDWTTQTDSEAHLHWKEMKERIVKHILEQERKEGNFERFLEQQLSGAHTPATTAERYPEQ